MFTKETCDCSCHSSFGKAYHCVPCCYTCQFCYRKIDTMVFEKHAKNCRVKYDPLINSVRVSELMAALEVLKKADLDLADVDNQIKDLLSSIFSKQ